MPGEGGKGASEQLVLHNQESKQAIYGNEEQ